MRVVAGSARGIQLKTIDSMSTRPTTDRVKEAVFSSIHHKIYGSRALDLFSGSGALGIELLSRGASEVFMVEASPSLERVIIENLNKTKLHENARVLIKDVYRVLEAIEGPFDLILLDPPYFSGDIEKVLEIVKERGLLSESGMVIAEHDNQDVFGHEGWILEKKKKYGKIGVSFLTEAK